MLQSFHDLMNRNLATDGGKAKLREAFFDPGTGLVRYMAVDIGGWLDATEVLVEADRLAPPGEEGASWMLRISESDLEAAPRWHEGMAEERIDLRAWPPVLVGPFGSTYSPLLMFEQLIAEQREHELPPAPDGDRLVRPLEEVGSWIGLPAFCTDGEIGPVADLLFEIDTRRVVTVAITPKSGTTAGTEAGSGATETTGRDQLGRILLPLTALRHRPKQGTHLVFDTTLQALHLDPA
ncbi:hypothetical protein [Citreimonas salinaria]|uniref:PRC-barrel domain-containing protein n=1 Tax=Citreimonas salinaria TaxID=321339 RepID=A0A1H3J4V7_9RHOB|nr:hypothetical protein [Citreimonas salinaria]SDY34579.1 hypothetical protein SAMN05444340_10640 [Citreimonas salinaria]